MSGVRSPHPPSTGHSAAGSASSLGPEGRRFESCCPDKYEKLLKYFQELFCFKFSFIKTIKPGQQDSKCSERREFKKTTHLLLTGSFVIDLGFITNPKNGRVKTLSIGCLDRTY